MIIFIQKFWSQSCTSFSNSFYLYFGNQTNILHWYYRFESTMHYYASTTLVCGGRWCTTRMASASARTKNLLSHDSSTSVEGFRTRKREVTDLRGRKANTYSLEAFLIQRSLERSSDDADFFENGETFFCYLKLVSLHDSTSTWVF